MEEQNQKKIVFFMRHGDRGDRSSFKHEKQRLEKTYDCHLTDLGCIQGEEAGKAINNFIQKTDPNIKKVKLVSSPFLRCIMTIENVAKGLGEKYQIIDQEIKVDNGVCELLSLDVLNHCPFTKGLNLRENNTEKYVKMKINDNNKNIDIPKFPEGNQDIDCFQRVVQGFQKVCKEFFEEQNNNDTALIITSHGGCVEALLSYYKIYDPITAYPLTNLNGFLFENEDQKNFKTLPKIICKQYDNHLQQADERYFQKQ